MEKIRFVNSDTAEEIEVCVLEQTCVSGCDYLLVTEGDDADEDADCYILKKINDEGEDVIYEFVEDDDTIDALAKIFEELMEVNFEKSEN